MEQAEYGYRKIFLNKLCKVEIGDQGKTLWFTADILEYNKKIVFIDKYGKVYEFDSNSVKSIKQLEVRQ